MICQRISSGRRIALSLGTTVFRDDGRASLARVLDMSFQGCRIASAQSFAVGERLRLHVKGQGCIEAEVRWTLGRAAGLMFRTDSPARSVGAARVSCRGA